MMRRLEKFHSEQDRILARMNCYGFGALNEMILKFV